jgi:DNA-binding NtrC family response regulator
MEKHILIIEDEADVCRLLTAHLMRMGGELRIDCAPTLAEGLGRAAADKPDMILLDNQLPDGWGVDHIRVLRSVCPGSRIVVVSAMDDIGPMVAERGADAFLAKPFTAEQVRQTLGYAKPSEGSDSAQKSASKGQAEQEK